MEEKKKKKKIKKNFKKNLILYFPVDQFSVGDIVWAKYYREPYWPAQVSLILILFHSIITII